MSMTPNEVKESQDLIAAHTDLRWNIAQNHDCSIRLCAADVDEKTVQPRLPPVIGRQIMLISLAIVEARLRELGVEPKNGLEHDCFECGGSGKQPMR